MLRALPVIIIAAALAMGCDPTGTPPPVEEKPSDFTPNLPAVPTLRVPQVPVTYPDGSYSVFGLRKKKKETMGQRIRVTGYVVDMYEKPFCPEGKTCPPAKMPHLWIADNADEKETMYKMTVVGYAEGFQQIAKCKEDALAGVVVELAEGVELPPCVWDWQPGKKYKVDGWFMTFSSHGFQDSMGLIDYKDHECIDCPPPETEETASQ
jgi:hypothetical protein